MKEPETVADNGVIHSAGRWFESILIHTKTKGGAVKMIFIDIKWINMLLPWDDILHYPLVECAPKITHARRIRWHTSGFR